MGPGPDLTDAYMHEVQKAMNDLVKDSDLFAAYQHERRAERTNWKNIPLDERPSPELHRWRDQCFRAAMAPILSGLLTNVIEYDNVQHAEAVLQIISRLRAEGRSRLKHCDIICLETALLDHSSLFWRGHAGLQLPKVYEEDGTVSLEFLARLDPPPKEDDLRIRRSDIVNDLIERLHILDEP